MITADKHPYEEKVSLRRTQALFLALAIRLDPQSLKLIFGIFSWSVPLENIAECRLDELPWLKKMGGAEIHFMSVRSRYRASFNFLEHPWVGIALKKNKGLVRDVSFSTRHPGDVLRLIREAESALASIKGNEGAGRETV